MPMVDKGDGIIEIVDDQGNLIVRMAPALYQCEADYCRMRRRDIQDRPVRLNGQGYYHKECI